MTIYQGIVEACKRAGATPQQIAAVVKEPPEDAHMNIVPGREETFIAEYIAILRGNTPTKRQIVKLFSNATGGPQN